MRKSNKRELDKYIKYQGPLFKGGPHHFGGDTREIIKELSDLVGSTITEVGFTKNMEGGLTFDYIKDKIKKRVVLGYTDLGEWIEWQGNLEQDNSKKDKAPWVIDGIPTPGPNLFSESGKKC